jgi:hypothetical protein
MFLPVELPHPNIHVVCDHLSPSQESGRLEQLQYVDWTHMAQDREEWRVLINKTMNP